MRSLSSNCTFLQLVFGLLWSLPFPGFSSGSQRGSPSLKKSSSSARSSRSWLHAFRTLLRWIMDVSDMVSFITSQGCHGRTSESCSVYVGYCMYTVKLITHTLDESSSVALWPLVSSDIASLWQTVNTSYSYSLWQKVNTKSLTTVNTCTQYMLRTKFCIS